jgi:hypothetical protein
MTWTTATGCLVGDTRIGSQQGSDGSCFTFCRQAGSGTEYQGLSCQPGASVGTVTPHDRECSEFDKLACRVSLQGCCGESGTYHDVVGGVVGGVQGTVGDLLKGPVGIIALGAVAVLALTR